MAVLSKGERRKEMSRKHASYAWRCSLCGKQVYGNGGKSGHQKMHKREAGYPYERFGWIVQELDRRAALAAELDAAQAQQDADSLAEFVARFSDQDADYRDWYATRESDRPQ